MSILKCPECGYEIPSGMHKCLCCGHTIKALQVVEQPSQTHADEQEGYKEIHPDDMYMGRNAPPSGGIFDSLFGGFGSFGGSPFGGIFQSFSSVIGSLFGDVFGEEEDEDGAEEDEAYTYDALGNRIPKAAVETVVVTDVEEYDENGELASQPTKKSKKKNRKA